MGLRYRKIYSSIWDDEKFQELTDQQQRVALYMLTCKASNRIGLFCFSHGEAAETLRMQPDQFRADFEAVCQRLGWRYDPQRRVLYIPTWWRYNEPDSSKILIGALDDLKEIPATPLRKEFAQNSGHFKKATNKNVFQKRMSLEGYHIPSQIPSPIPMAIPMPIGSGVPMPIGHPYQEQEQEQEQDPPHGGHGGNVRNSKAPSQPALPLEAPIPTSLDTAEFRAAWAEYQQHRMEIRKPLTPTAAKRRLASLATMGPASAIAAIHRSVENGWQGIFPDSKQKAGGARTQEQYEREAAENTRRQRERTAKSLGVKMPDFGGDEFDD